MDMAGYVASKQALCSSARTLALELGPQGITANVIEPGMVRTGMTSGLLEDPAISTFFTSLIPVGRVGGAEEVAEAVAYLADLKSGYCNGATIRLDGGYTVSAHASDWAP